MSIKVILSPYANRWNARRRWPEAEKALQEAGVDFSLAISEHAGEPEALATRAVQDGFDTIIVAGGDGTIGEVLNGVACSGSAESNFPATLGILPMGSANDLAFALGIPLDLSAAARVIAAGKSRLVDASQCNDRFFINNSGIALEPYVTTKQEKIRWIRGIARYLVAAVWAIMEKPEWQGSVEWEAGEYEGPLSLVSVGNGRRTGGFFLTPHADPFDGQLTLAYGYRATRRSILAVFPRLLKEGAGNYVELPGMYEVNCRRVKIHLEPPSPVHTDGVLFRKWAADFDYKIHPAAVPVLMPAHE